MAYTTNQIKDSIKRVSEFVIKNKRKPNSVKLGNNTLNISDYLKLPELVNAKKNVQEFQKKNGRCPNYVSINGFNCTKDVYTKLFSISCTIKDPTLAYFVSKFGNVKTIDEILTKINNKGYAHYYNGKYTNKESIDRIYNKKGINCTDSTELVAKLCTVLGYKCTCYHVKCSSGEGHVFLKVSHPTYTNGKTITRDPACVLSNNGKSIKCVWCSNGKLIDTNPSWWNPNK